MGAKRRAVIIDDEPDLARYISSILADHDFDTKTANDARSGEDLVRETQPDLICIDLMMPGRSGVQLFSRLKGNEATRDIPLIMITGIKEKMGIDWANVAGGLSARRPDGFIEKPVDPVRLMRVVEDVLVHRKEGVQFG